MDRLTSVSASFAVLALVLALLVAIVRSWPGAATARRIRAAWQRASLHARPVRIVLAPIIEHGPTGRRITPGLLTLDADGDIAHYALDGTDDLHIARAAMTEVSVVTSSPFSPLATKLRVQWKLGDRLETRDFWTGHIDLQPWISGTVEEPQHPAPLPRATARFKDT